MIMENDKFYIQERILNMSQEEIRSEIDVMDKYREELKKYRELCDKFNLYIPIAEEEIKLLDKAATIWGAFNQIKWERDIAISQLEELGLGLGEKVDHIKELIEAKKALAKTEEK